MAIAEERRAAHVARLTSMFHAAPIARSFGMRLAYDAERCAVFTLPYNAGFDHGLGGIHGGVFATLLDNAGWFTVAAEYETWVATVEFQVRLLAAVQKEESSPAAGLSTPANGSPPPRWRSSPRGRCWPRLVRGRSP